MQTVWLPPPGLTCLRSCFLCPRRALKCRRETRRGGRTGTVCTSQRAGLHPSRACSSLAWRMRKRLTGGVVVIEMLVQDASRKVVGRRTSHRRLTVLLNFRRKGCATRQRDWLRDRLPHWCMDSATARAKTFERRSAVTPSYFAGSPRFLHRELRGQGCATPARALDPLSQHNGRACHVFGGTDPRACLAMPGKS